MVIRSLILLAAMLPPPGQSSDQQALALFSKSMETAPADQRLAYNVLQVAFATFRDAHLRHETCHEMAACNQMKSAEQDRLTHDYLLMAHGFSGVTPPSFTEDQFAAADQELNASFAKVTAGLPESCVPADCLSKSTFQEVERDWIRYRDAWVTFASLRWPAISADSWQTYLTRQRTAELNASFKTILCCQ